MTLTAIRPREASIFACLTDAFVAPAGPLPDVRHTDAAFAFDAHVRAAPKVNRVGLRALLLALEVLPLALGFGARLRRLDRTRREHFVSRLERIAAADAALQGLRGLAQLCYYGDEGVLRRLGYDPEAVVARGRELRLQEARW
jgi:hypothetical protein